MYTLDTAATASEDGSRIAIAAVNKHPDEFREFSVILSSQPREYRLMTVNGPSKDSFNDLTHTDVKIKEGEWKPASGREVTVSLEHHSVNIRQFRM